MDPFNIEAEMASFLNGLDVDELRSFAKLQEDTCNGEQQNELYIYTCFIIFQRSRSMEHIERAIQKAEGWIAVTPANHQDRIRRLNILDMLTAWMHQYMLILETFNSTQQNVLVDQDGIYPQMHQAMSLLYAAPQDHPDRAGWLNNLGNWLGSRFERTGSMDDLNRAVEVTTAAVDATPQDHPDRAGWLNNLGNWLGRRFERTGSMDDLNRAVEVATAAVDATPQDHPDRAGRLNNLGNRLGSRFERTGLENDVKRALLSYEDSWNCRTAAPSIRIHSARNAAKLLVSQSNWKEASRLLRESVQLLPAVSPRTLKQADAQHTLMDVAGLATTAASIALNAGEDPFHVLQLLELGRGVMAGLLMDMRGDISNLKLKHPGLADEFISLRDELDSPEDGLSSMPSTSNMSSWNMRANRRRQADENFQKLIRRIRDHPGFDNFLQPPAKRELMSAAYPDPVIVINVSSYRSDAFLVQSDSITAIKLDALKLEEVQTQLEKLQQPSNLTAPDMLPLLEWLWNTVCGPCLDALGFQDSVSDDNWPRVWWVPTGVISQFPLHAAGRYTQKSRATVLDRVMSSYASSIRALLHGRQRQADSSTSSAVLVGMHETPDLPARILPFVRQELDMLIHSCLSLQLKPIIPTQRKEDVLQSLQRCKIFHFAGHGKSDLAEPLQSCLLLEDWKTTPLTVGDLFSSRLQEHPPFLAYLSACSTGANRAVLLLDEGIHLVNAFQLAGFRHVVGALWEVSDRHCVDAARIVYETLQEEGMTDVAVCRGLHRAVRALRDGEIGQDKQARDAELVSSGTQTQGFNPCWIPYVHFGV